MTNVYGFSRPATAPIPIAKPLSLFETWQSLKKQFIKLCESNKKLTTKDDTSSVISDTDTLEGEDLDSKVSSKKITD